MTKEYLHWIGMMTRCYNSSQEHNSSYENVCVSNDWHYFQNFAEWCQLAPNFGRKGWHLDKDLLFPENNVYSEKSCVFLPIEINAALPRKTRNIKTQDLPVGISYNPHNDRLQVPYYDMQKCRQTSKAFKNIDEAITFVAEVKYNKLKVGILKYDNLLSPIVIQRLEDIIKN